MKKLFTLYALPIVGVLFVLVSSSFGLKAQGEKQAVYRASETKFVDLINTELHLAFNWENKEVIGTAILDLSPHFKNVSELVLDAKFMEIKSVSLNAQALQFQSDSMFLKVVLDKAYQKEDTFQLEINYSAFPDRVKSGGSKAITDAKGLYFINSEKNEEGRMPQFWTQGETEANSVWFPTIDAPNQKHTQELFIEVEPEYKVLSNGVLLNVEKNADAWTYHWKQDLKHAPYLTMMAVGKFVEIKDSVQLGSGRILPLSFLVESHWQDEAKELFQNTGEMIKHFSELLGVEFPWDKYSQVVVRNYVSGAMENTSAVIFGDFVYSTSEELLDKNYDDIIAHELFHHWFGDLLTCESWSNLPLNESFANYSQYLWDEYKYGKDVAQFYALQETFGYLGSAKFSGHHNMIWFDYDEKEDMFDGHSYNKGGRILNMLRNYLGDELFFASIKYYLSKNSFRAVEIHDLRLAFEEISGEDLNWFFNQWFLDDHYPVLNLTHSVEGNVLSLNVQQVQDLNLSPLYILPVNLKLFTTTGEYSFQFKIEDEIENLEFEFEGELENFILDGDRVLLAEINTDKPASFFIHQYYARENFLDRYWMLQEITKSSSEALQDVLLDALQDPFFGVRYYALEKVNVFDKKHKKKAIEILKDIVIKDANSLVRERALHLLGLTLKKGESIDLAKSVLESDISWLVKAEALKIMGETKLNLALKYASTFENEKSNKIIQAVARLYGEHGGADQKQFFVNTLKSTVLNDNTYGDVLIYYNQFLNRQGLKELMEALHIVEELAVNKMGNTMKIAPLVMRNLLDKASFQIQSKKVEVEQLRENNDTTLAFQLNKEIEQWEKELKYFEELYTDLK